MVALVDWENMMKKIKQIILPLMTRAPQHPQSCQIQIVLPLITSAPRNPQFCQVQESWFFAKISVKSVVDTHARSQVVMVKGESCRLSRSLLSESGWLPERFPVIGRFSKSQATDQPAGGTSGIILSSVGSSSGGDQPGHILSSSADGDKSGVDKEAVRQPCSYLGREFTDSPAPTPSQYPVSGVEYSGNNMGLIGDPTTLANGQVIELLQSMMSSTQNHN